MKHLGIGARTGLARANARGLPALRTKRRLLCQGPRERDDGREIREGVVKCRTGIVDLAQSETVRHHYDVLPFAGDATWGLFMCGVSARVIVVVWKYICYGS
jgi:hypothetical protein